MSLARNLLATVITFIGVALALSVVQGWNWPVLGGSVRWGIVALGAVSLFACTSSGWTATEARTWYRDPWIIAAMVLGTAVLLTGVVGLFVGTMPYLVLMLGGTILLWVVSTVHHLVAAAGGGRRLTVS